MSHTTQEYARELEAQRAANQSALPYYDAFGSHRARLTGLLREAAREALVGSSGPTSEQPPSPGSNRVSSSDAGPKLCVLGAGNAYDLNLPELAEHFSTIHLVDIDGAALQGCVDREDEVTRAKLKIHPSLDVSGLLDRLERWRRMELTPAELMGHAERTAIHVRRVLGGTFDVVVSACMLSQMQLTLLRELGADHRLFEAVRMTLTLTHLRTLLGLLPPSGRALFVTDVSADAIAPLPAPSASDARPLVWSLAEAGRVFQFAHPGLLLDLARQDPVLSSAAQISDLKDAWVWQNGEAGRFLVYALELRAAPKAQR